MAERVLTLRELNRATLARQLLLERKRLSPVKVIEHLVGMQAQWPSTPYVGIWTRTTSFRRGTLERELAKGSVLKANLMRQTLHLVTRRDYGLLRAAISESGHPDQWPNSIKVAPSVRAVAERRPVTMAEGLELLEREHGLTGITARRAWHGGRMRAHVLHHHETAPGRSLRRDRGARAGRARRGASRDARALPRGLRACLAKGHGQVEHAAPACDQGRARAPRAASGTSADSSSSTSSALRCRIPIRPLPSASSRSGTTSCSRSPTGRVLPEEYRRTVIGSNGDVAQTFLVDGLVAGMWSVEKGRVVLEPLARLSRSVRREVEDEAERLEAFVVA